MSPRHIVLHALEFWICDGGWAFVVHMEVPMSPAPRLSVLMDCELREFDWRSHWETNASFSR
jgi:hypothetical protein